MMSCTQYQDLISEYIDGHLEPGEQSKVEHHLSECGCCRVVRDDLLQIVHFSRKLPSLAPSGLVWANIRSEIEGAAGRNWFTWLRSCWAAISEPRLKFSIAQAGFTLAIVVVVAPMLMFVLQSGGDSSVAVESQRTEIESVRATMQGIQQRINQLEAVIEERRTEWDPQLRTVFDRNMLHIDQTLAECQRSLRSNPNDDISQEFILNAYQEKVRLLEGFSEY